VMEYGFDWIGFVGLLLTGAAMLAGVWWKLHQGTEKLRHDNAVQFAATAHVIAEFKLEVARNYATNNSIREVEQRVVDAIDRLGDRLDKFLENRNR
jgi:hypothetical protein